MKAPGTRPRRARPRSGTPDREPFALDALVRAHVEAVEPHFKARLELHRKDDGSDASEHPDRTRARWRTIVVNAFSSDDPILAGLSPHGLILLYETLLGYQPVHRNGRVVLTADPRERRTRGAFYTPGALAERIVDETVGPYLANGVDPASLRILDPAAGGGVFLLAAAKRLGCVPAGMTGLDRDPGALAVARLVFRRAFPDAPLPTLQEGDALLDGDMNGQNCDTGNESEHATFDVVLGNPPFLNVKRGALSAVSARLRARFQTARGQFDTWALFVELALARLRPGGRLGLVLPRPFLAAESYASIRRLLLETGHLECVSDLGLVFAGAGVEAVAVVARKKATDDSRPRPLRFVDRTGVSHSGPSSRSFLMLPHAAISTACGPADMAFLRAVQQAPERLGDWVTVTRGIECGKRHPAVVREAGRGRERLLCGHQVDAYRTQPGSFVDLERLPPDRRKPASLFGRRPKILVRRVSDQLKAAVDESGAYVLNTLYILEPGHAAGDHVCYLLSALLNSAILGRYHRLAFASEDLLFPYVRKSQLVRLPVPSRSVWDSPEGSRLSALARRAHEAPDRVARQAMDRIVADWYGMNASAPG